MEIKPSKPKPPPKPKLPPKPQGLNLQQRGTKPGRLRLHISRMFSLSSSSNSQPSSPTVLSPVHGLSPAHELGMAQAVSCENLPVSSISKRSQGSVSSGGGNSSGEPSPDLTKRRQHWRARSDTKHVRQLLGQQRANNQVTVHDDTRRQQDDVNLLDQGATQDLFDLVVRAQRNRLDDQRCELPRPSVPAAVCTPPPSPQSDVEEPRAPTTRMLLEEVLRGPEPLPMFLLPPGGGYWADGGDPVTAENCSWQHVPTPELETDEAATSYRRHFMGREHFTLMLEDANLGPVILSVRHVEGGATRLLVRLRSGTKHLLLPHAPPSDCTPAQLVKMVSEDAVALQNERFTPVVCARAAELLANYDEHALSSAFKFGVVPQQRGQTTEEQLFSNRDPSPALLAFLDLLGNRVRLRDHKGYRGGLDTQFGQTGEEAVYRVFRGCEVMFHVAPLLPFAENDPQQLQRKRHVGNDIVAIIFQEENTPFAPDMIASHFLHVFIIVQPIDAGTPRVRYRVAVTAREGVPKFGPPLPNSSIFKPGPELQDWLLVKLINAETAAYKATTFAALRSRTRTALLGNLAQDLRSETRRFLGDDTNVIATSTSAPSTPPATNAVTSGSRFIDTVRKALSARPKPATSKIAEAPLTPTQKDPPPLTPNGVQGDATVNEETDAVRRSICRSLTVCESSPSEEGDASSLSSAGDTGLESMTSHRARSRLCSCAEEMARLRTEVADLQRQNTELRERNGYLQTEMTITAAELSLLREASNS